jgi:hypothetical protein
MRRVVLRDSLAVVQESRMAAREHRGESPTTALQRKTDRMVLMSFPTLFAYAPWSLLNFVLLLILKNTSSPFDASTYRPSKADRQLNSLQERADAVGLAGDAP